jgi:hypothetical protein
MPALTADEWLSLSQAAVRLVCSSQRVRNLAEAGRVGMVRTALGRLVSAEDVARLAAQDVARRQGGEADPLLAGR